MKITDEQIIEAIWNNQLRLLSRNVLVPYFSGRHGVCCDDDFSFEWCSVLHIPCVSVMTDAASPEQITRRIRKLINAGEIHSQFGQDVMVNNDTARSAFNAARQFWLEQGVPEDESFNIPGPVVIDDFESKAAACLAMLQEKYPRGSAK